MQKLQYKQALHIGESPIPGTAITENSLTLYILMHVLGKRMTSLLNDKLKANFSFWYNRQD